MLPVPFQLPPTGLEMEQILENLMGQAYQENRVLDKNLQK